MLILFPRFFGLFGASISCGPIVDVAKPPLLDDQTPPTLAPGS